MSRSVKKGPYVDAKLLKRLETMNRVNERRVLKTWARRTTISRGARSSWPRSTAAACAAPSAAAC